MNPTCGPLPWVMAISQPIATKSAMEAVVSRIASYWSATVWCCLSLISELPPMATTARLARIRTSAAKPAYMVRAITAFCAWRRFSASSYTTLCGPSMTASATSMLRSAGRQCM